MQRTEEDKIWEILCHLFTLDMGNGSYTKFKSPPSNIFEGLKTTTWNLKYEWFNDGSEFLAKKINYKDLHIFSHNFTENKERNQADMALINKKLKNLIYFCYRKNYRFYNTGLRSDTGWGCMIRCYQMLVCRAFYKIFKKQFIPDEAKIRAISFFKETPTSINDCMETMVVYIDNFIKLSKSKSKDKDIKVWYFLPPFCLQCISYFGLQFHNTAPGNWFGDVVLAQIFSKINSEINRNSFCQILNFQTNIDIVELRKKCFRNVNELNEAEKIKIDGTTKFPGMEDEFVLNKPCLIFVSVRLGLRGIAEEYLSSIQNLFSFKGCLGILGGRTNAAYYFFGYFNNEFFLYLDPHLTREAAKDLKNQNDLNTYFNKDIHYIKFKHMAPSFTIGFLFRDIKEFEAFQAFVEEHKKREFPCFGVVSSEKVDKAIEEMVINDKDDF